MSKLLEKSKNDSEEKVMMLGKVIESQDLEISKLKITLVACEKCDVNDKVVSDVESQYLKSMINTENENHAGNRKLKNHMCRVHVENPSQCELYMAAESSRLPAADSMSALLSCTVIK